MLDCPAACTMEAMNPKPVPKAGGADGGGGGGGGGAGACPLNPEDDEDCCDPGSE